MSFVEIWNDFISAFGFQTELAFRIFLSCIIGIVIGYERHTRAKEAGMRTHCIVACASALMMIVSKYGFFDMFQMAGINAADIKLDPSRMAQGIVTGVGFLGAGIIYFQRGALKGLTTSAGIWAVSGIGITIGAGMYFIGITATVLILFVQFILHRKVSIFLGYKLKKVKFFDVTEEGFSKKAIEEFKNRSITVVDVSIKQNDDMSLEYTFFIEMPQNIDEESLIGIFDYKMAVDYLH